ncbi:MAG TPA: MFS transporter [Povalibacter sp.]|nr:MFS transporter [Povalibacter sp.]
MTSHSSLPSASPQLIEQTYRKVLWRLLPFLMLCYVFNFIERTNIGIAKLQFMEDLQLPETVYGWAVSIFFIGYVMFEVPSNLMLNRVGARATLLRIMVLWGLVSAGMALVTTPASLYVARFLLGAAEAGFVPGVFLYLTYWFPANRRARITSLFYLALPLSVLIGSPLAGWIMKTFDGYGGLHGWQWLFLLEGIPSVLLGIAAFFYLQDKPERAHWLTADEKNVIAGALASEERRKGHGHAGGLAQVLRDPRIYLLGLVSFASYSVSNMNNYWAPTLIRNSGVEDVFLVGLLGALPPILGAAVMVLNSRHSDRTLERRWHAALPLMLAGIAIGLLPTFRDNTQMSIVLIGLLAGGHYATLAVFWTIPSDYLPKSAAAAGIAFVSTIGALGAFVAPNVLTWTQKLTGSSSLGFYLTSGFIIAGAIILLIAMPARLLAERKSDGGAVAGRAQAVTGETAAAK